MAGLNIWKNEYHIVRVELKGPKSIKELLQFDNALKQFVEENGGIVRILAKEKDKLRASLGPGRGQGKGAALQAINAVEAQAIRAEEIVR